MAASAGTVTLNLDANSVKLLRELQKSQNATRKTSGTMAADFEKSFTRIAKASAAMAAVLLATTTKLTRDGLASVDAQAKMARAVNGTNDALKALQMAAGDVGLQGLDGALTRMNRRLGAAEFGAGAAAVTVKALNLDLEALSKMDIDQRLQSIAQSIDAAGISSEQAARHLQNLGFEQAQASEFFAKGISDLSGYQREVRQLGLSLSLVDSYKVEQANDAMGVFGDLIQGVSQRMAVNFAPILTEISNGILGAAMDSEALGDKIDRIFNNMVIGAITLEGAVRPAIVGVGSALSSIWGGYQRLPAAVQEFGIIAAILMPKKGLIAITAGLALLDSTAWRIERNNELWRTVLGEEPPGASSAGAIISSLFGSEGDIETAEGRTQRLIAVWENAKARMAAESAAANPSTRGGGFSTEDQAQIEQDAKELEAAIDKSAEFLNILRDRFKSEQELLAKKYIADDAMLSFAHENKLVLDKEFYALQLEMAEEFEKAQTAIVATEEEARQDARASATDAILTNLDRQIMAIRGYTEESSALGKIAFIAGQALAAASAIISGYSTAGSIRSAYGKMAETLAENPAAALAALAAGEAHATASIGMGYVTAGLIAGQTVGSFEGGGYTGNGARSGGMDGKGGFLAMLHPQETVTDHAQGQGGGAVVNFTINANDTRGFDQLLQSRRGLITTIVNQAVNNSGRRSIA